MSKYISRLKNKARIKDQEINEIKIKNSSFKFNPIVNQSNLKNDLQIKKKNTHLKLNSDISINESVKRHEAVMIETQNFLDQNLQSVRKAELINKL